LQMCSAVKISIAGNVYVYRLIFDIRRKKLEIVTDNDSKNYVFYKL
jgi:hypothetical protein